MNTCPALHIDCPALHILSMCKLFLTTILGPLVLSSFLLCQYEFKFLCTCAFVNPSFQVSGCDFWVWIGLWVSWVFWCVTSYGTLSYTTVPGPKPLSATQLLRKTGVIIMTSGFGLYHGLWLDDTPTKHIGIISTPWTMMDALGLVQIHQAHE
jgi:hypothetical protein